MKSKREFLLGSMATGLITLGGRSMADAAPAPPTIRDILKQTVGDRSGNVGMIAVIVGKRGARLTTYGGSGVTDVELDGDTVFEIGSMTKVMTALILADMVSRGELSFDDPVAKFLPPSVTLRARGRPITLLDIATYRSGLPNTPSNFRPPLAGYTVDRLYEFLSSYTPVYEPGSHYEYSNLSYGLLGVALARLAGKSYEELLIERVCDPLGLEHTRITLTTDMRRHLAQGHDRNFKPTPLLEMPAMQGAGAVRSNANDLTVFLKAGMGMIDTPLSPAFARLLDTRKQTTLPGTEVGLGWFISTNRKDEIVWKSGVTAGFKTFMAFSPQSRRGSLVISNFLWQPIDDDLGIRILNPQFRPGDFKALYSND